MSEVKVKEYALANIAMVEIETEEDSPTKYRLTDVASEAEVTAYISEGKEQELRVKNTIKAQNKTQDIVLGYDIRFISATMIPEILALVDGGTWDPINKRYSAPVIGIAVERIPYTTHVYTEEKDADGSTLGYAKFSYLHCEGKPANYKLQDGEFFVPELTSKSRPKMKESPVEIEFIDTLPEDDITITYETENETKGTVSPTTETIGERTGTPTGSTATAKDGYEFVNWTDEKGKVVGMEAEFVPKKVSGVYREATYTANFKAEEG